jgi:organic radical activating enzyme
MMNEWYCPLPFKHVFVDSVGVAVCCKSPRQSIDLDQWVNSEHVKNIQQQMLNGQVPTICQGCVSEEKMTGRSLRTDSQQDYNHQRFVETAIDFIDYRANNICNFKCRSCSPIFSHGIDNETKNSTILQKFHQPTDKKIVSINDTNTEWISQNLKQIKRLMLTGGEPTRMPEIKSIIEQIAYDKLDTQILITTNGSFEDNFWYELTRLHENLHWTVSLDAVGAAAEIIRNGTDWKIVEKNARWLASHASSMNINTTITHLNILQLGPLLQFVKELQKESIYPRGRHGGEGLRHQFIITPWPTQLSVDCLPPDLRTVSIAHLNNCLALNLDLEQKQAIEGLVTHLEHGLSNSNQWQRSLEFNQELDRIRGENYMELYEEKTFIN